MFTALNSFITTPSPSAFIASKGDNGDDNDNSDDDSDDNGNDNIINDNKDDNASNNDDAFNSDGVISPSDNGNNNSNVPGAAVLTSLPYPVIFIAPFTPPRPLAKVLNKRPAELFSASSASKRYRDR